MAITGRVSTKQKRGGANRPPPLKQLEHQDILILYELGYVPFSKTAAELLFEVISRAYERLSLIITTNLPV